MIKRAFLAFGFLCLLFPPPVLSAPKSDNERIAEADSADVLKGLDGVYIVIENIIKDAENDGLKTEAIRIDMELKLRQSGIKILSREEYNKRPENAFLTIAITTVKSNIGIYAYDITVCLHENTTLIRNNKTIVIGAVTWSQGLTGIVKAEDIKMIRESVKDEMNKFCNDYLKANPIVAKRIIVLTGAAAAYYWYNHHKNPEQNKEKAQYYISKAVGRIYYRDTKTHQAHWVMPPQAPVEVAEDEAKQYKRFKGYNNQIIGDDLSNAEEY